MNTVTVSIRESDHEFLKVLSAKNDRKIVDQFHVIIKNLQKEKKCNVN